MSTQQETSDASSHFVGELGLDVQAHGEIWTGRALVPPGACIPGTRFPRASTLLMYADVIAGGQARALTLPQLSVTVDLALDVVESGAPRREVGELVLSSRILRAGKRLIFTETTISAEEGPVAVCTGTFSAISRTLNAFGDAAVTDERPSRHERRLLSVPLVERVGLVVPAPGRAEIARRGDLGNSTDSLMGGLHSLLGEVAAVSRVESETRRPFYANRVQVRYLAPIRVGPARASVQLLGGGDPLRYARVEVRDTGSAEQLAADVTVTCLPAG